MVQPEYPGLSPITFWETLQSANEQVLQTIYTSCYRSVEQYVTKNSGTIDDARDIYQETFLSVWRNVCLKRFMPASEKEYGAYLFRVAKNKWIDQLRAGKNKYFVELTDSGTAETVNPETDVRDNYIDVVTQQFSNLGERCRELLELFYFKKQSLLDISEHFSWTEASAKNNKYRCLKQLRELVIQKGKQHE